MHGFKTLVFVLALAACGGGEADGTQHDGDVVTRAATVAKAIQADPDNASTVLESHELSEEQFEAMLYEIAADADKSKAYADALGK